MSILAFGDKEIAEGLLGKIRTICGLLPDVKLMEVCGTHTMEIGRLGLRSLLPKNLHLCSGPGCPVCVTPGSIIDRAVELGLEKKIRILAFGDMIRVPGNKLSLEAAKTQGANIDVVTSPLHACKLAQQSPEDEFVVVAVGFETTIPAVALSIIKADETGLKNLSFLCSHRLVPPALDLLCADPGMGIHGFLLPGHVSAIIGEKPYSVIDKYRIPGVITGFAPLEILAGIYTALVMILNKECGIVNRYTHVVPAEGNPNALECIYRVFSVVDAYWRGIGKLPNSGLAIVDRYAHLDATRKYGAVENKDQMPPGCSCSSVLRGIIFPNQCPQFGIGCTPAHPCGPCMVSSEGSCAAYYRYGEDRNE